MSYNKAYKFLDNSIKNEIETINVISLYNKEIRDLIVKLKNKKEISEHICNINTYKTEEIIFNYKNLDLYIKKELKDEVRDCNLQYKIFYMIIEHNNSRHINLYLIDNKKKIIERFDTIKQHTEVMEKISKLIMKNFKINYEIIHPNKFIFDETRKDCGLCVPLSLLYIYIRIKYNLELDDISKLFSSFNNKNLFRISDWFINYLNSK